MLATIFSSIGLPLIDAVLGKFLDAFKAYENKQISVEQLRDQLYAVMVNAAKDIEVAHADALAKTYASFMDAMSKSKLMQQAWAAVVVSQLFVLVWSQFFIPLIVTLKLVDKWASAGTTVEWAYLLLGGCLGMGPMVLRAGPGAGDISARIKSMIGKSQ